MAPTRARAAAVAVVGYAILARVAPPLIAALALVVTVVLLARAQRLAVARRPAWLMTCALALPVIASAQFYLGYPLRTCVSAITAQLLNFAGVDVQVEGTALLLRGTRVLVDRLWPRGISKAKAAIDVWEKDASPSNDLRKFYDHRPERWAEFQERYRAELKSTEAEAALTRLRDLARAGPLTLLTATRAEADTHLTVLEAVLRDR